ncbi:MAG: Hsp20/alpha crystallin family protein [Bacteroidota bacterium]
MTLVYVEPVREIERISDRMHRLFDEYPETYAWGRGKTFSPRIDLHEDEKNLYVEAELPGMTKDDVKVTIHARVLTIQGKRRVEQKREGTNYLRIESTYGTFSRSVNLPEEVNADKVGASFEDGVLWVELPKKSTKETQRLIEIK